MTTRQQHINAARAKVDILHGRVQRIVSWDMGFRDYSAVVAASFSDGVFTVEQLLRDADILVRRKIDREIANLAFGTPLETQFRPQGHEHQKTT